MDIRVLRSEDVSASALRSLALEDVGVDLFSEEALTASIRRAASFLCPTTPGRIAKTVFEALVGLPGATANLRSELDSLVDRLVAYGDLLDLATRANEDDGPRRIYLGPPSYVLRTADAVLLLGVRPEGASLVDDGLAALIEYESHTRTLTAQDMAGLVEQLRASRLKELTRAQWLRAPRNELAPTVVADYEERLKGAPASGAVDGLTVLDHAAPVEYYRGRWRNPKRSDHGNYLTRRPQAYGADLWCFASFVNGEVAQLIDLPTRGDPSILGRDEAWRIQAAIDATLGHPQLVRVRPAPDGKSVFDFLSPVPTWAQRYLDAIGIPVSRGSRSLFSYKVSAMDAPEAADFLSQTLWMSVHYTEGTV